MIIEKLLDRYTPAEIVEKLEMTNEEFQLLMQDYILENLSVFEDDLEEYADI